MRKIIPLLTMLVLAGCANFQQNLAKLTSDVVAVNQAIAQASASLAQNCNIIASVAQTLVPFAKIGSNAAGDLAAANAVIQTWCQQPPIEADGLAQR